MLRYLPGILLLQCATAAIIWFMPQPIKPEIWAGITLAVVLLGVFVSLWFSSIAKNTTQDAVNKTKLDFAKEREQYQVKAERAKTKLVEKTQKQIASEARKTQGKANIKVGGAFAAAVGAGILMLIIELLTFGLMTLTTAAGAMGGYLVRSKKAHREMTDRLPKTIEVKETSRTLPIPSMFKKSLPTDKK
jgi:Flp pilus assembly protein TadB